MAGKLLAEGLSGPVKMDSRPLRCGLHPLGDFRVRQILIASQVQDIPLPPIELRNGDRDLP